MEDAGSKSSICFAKDKCINKMPHVASATRRDHGNAQHVVQLFQRVYCKPIFGAIVIHAGIKNFTSTALLALACPAKQFFVCRVFSTVSMHDPLIIHLTCIYGQND